MSIPQEKEARELVLDRVKKCVELMKEQDTLKGDIASYKEEICDKYDITKAEFQNLVKAAYDEAKLEEEIEIRQTALSELDILRNGTEEG